MIRRCGPNKTSFTRGFTVNVSRLCVISVIFYLGSLFAPLSKIDKSLVTELVHAFEGLTLYNDGWKYTEDGGRKKVQTEHVFRWHYPYHQKYWNKSVMRCHYVAVGLETVVYVFKTKHEPFPSETWKNKFACRGHCIVKLAWKPKNGKLECFWNHHGRKYSPILHKLPRKCVTNEFILLLDFLVLANKETKKNFVTSRTVRELVKGGAQTDILTVP